MKRNKFNAVITGASSGVGRAYAILLAQKGYDLIITGRRLELLNQLSDEIKRQYPVEVQIVRGDLSDSRHRSDLTDLIRVSGDIDVLVNNAGFGIDVPFRDLNLEEIQSMIATHVLATSELISAVLPGMTRRNHGHIINVSSLCSFLPGLSRTLYLATKAYVHYFSRALSIELAHTGINIQSLCLGFVATDFFRAVRTRDPGHEYLKMFFLTPKKVVQESFSASERGSSLCIPGNFYKIGYLVTRLLPFPVFRLLNWMFSKKMEITEQEQVQVAFSGSAA